MATITGYTANRMKEIEDSAIIDGAVVGDDLILTRFDGVTINAGDVRGPVGPQGPENIQVVDNAASRPATPFDGLHIYELDTKRVYGWNGTAWIYRFGGTEPLYSAKAYRSTALSAAAAPSSTLIPMNTKTWDYNNNFDTATGRYTVPVTGLYQCNGQIAGTVQNAVEEMEATLFVDGNIRTVGTRFVVRGGSAGDNWSLTVSDLIPLTAGQLVDLRVYHGLGGNPCALVISSLKNWLSICKVA